MSERKWVCVVVSILGLCLSSCASIMSGTKQKMTFNSNPSGATVSVNGEVLGQTPLETKLKKQSQRTVTFQKDGYKPVSMPLKTTVSPMFYGNILVGGLIGSTTDGATGAVNQYSPNQYLVTLEPQTAGNLESKTSLTTEQRVKEFIVMNHTEILSELRRGDGEYVSSLAGLLTISNEKRPQAFKVWRALSVTYPDSVDFANQVAANFVR